MRRLIVLAALLCAATASATDYYVATKGSSSCGPPASGSGVGTIGDPFTFYQAWQGHNSFPSIHIKAGDNVWLRCGDYSLQVGGNGGNPSSSASWYTSVGGVQGARSPFNGGTVSVGVHFQPYNHENARIDFNAALTSASGNLIGEYTYPCFNDGAQQICPGQGNTYQDFVVFNSNTTQSRDTGAGITAPANQMEFVLQSHGSALVNFRSYDSIDGLQKNGGSAALLGSGNLVSGAFADGCGFIFTSGGVRRGGGHCLYIQNVDTDGDAYDRSIVDGFVGFNAYDNPMQVYATNTMIAYITIKNSIWGPHGICQTTGGSFPCGTTQFLGSWPAESCCSAAVYFGAAGGVNEHDYGCRVNGQPLGSKVLWKLDFNHNWVLDGAADPISIGDRKGACDDSWTFNDFVTTGVQVATGSNSPYTPTPVGYLTPTPPPPPTPTQTPFVTCNASTGCCHNYPNGCGFYETTPGTMAFTNNKLYSPLNGGGLPLRSVQPGFGAGDLSATNYTGNTISAGFPNSGIVQKVWHDPIEPGRGFIAFQCWNGASCTTTPISVNLDTLVGDNDSQPMFFNGEKIRIQNAMNYDPLNPALDVTNGEVNCTATCGTVSLNLTSDHGVRQPAFAKADLSGPFQKPPDRCGTTMCFAVLFFDQRWESVSTTPTNTPTITNTPTNTATSTPTWTASPTPTKTPTLTPSLTPTGTIPPTSTKTPTTTNTPTFTAAATFTPSVTPTPVTVQNLVIDPGLCTINGPGMALTSDSTAPFRHYVSTTVAGNGSVPTQHTNDFECPVLIPSTGYYFAWFAVKAPGDQSGGHDSVYVQWPGDAYPATTSSNVFDMSDFRPCDGSADTFAPPLAWTFELQNDRSVNCCNLTGSAGTGCQRSDTPGGQLGKFMGAGVNTVTVIGRETLAQIGEIILTTDPTFTPGSPTGPLPPIGNNVRRIIVSCNGQSKPLLVPGGVSKISPCPWPRR